MSNILTHNAPKSCGLTAALYENISARSSKAKKAVETTIERGQTLLADGYKFATRRDVDNAYCCTSPEGQIYNLEVSRTSISCDCPASAWLGICKHAYGLNLYRAEIDMQVTEDKYPAYITFPVATEPVFIVVKSWTWNELWSEIDAEKAVN